MNLEKNFFAIIGLALALLCFSNNYACAAENIENTKIQAQTAKKFLESIKRQDLAEKIDDDVKGVLCGSIDKICAEDQICLRCRMTLGEKAHYEGFCVSKDTDLSQFTGYSPNSQEVNLDEMADYQKKLNEQLGVETKRKFSGYRSCEPSGSFFDYEQRYSNDDIKQLKDQCFVGNGKQYCISILGDTVSIEYGEASMKGCEVLPVKLYNLRKCFFCPLFSVVFAASEKMPDITFKKLAPAFATLIALGMAIWIAFQTLTHVSSLTKQDAPKFLAGLIKQSYKFLIAFLLLQYSSQIFEYAVNPVLQAGIKFGGQFLEYASVEDKQIANEIKKDIENRAKDVPAFGYYIKNSKKTQEDKRLYKDLDWYVSSIQREIAFMQAVGSSLICTGNGKMFSEVDTTTFAQGFKMILQGLILAVFGFLLSIAFAFYMIDAVVQLGIVGALMPFLIASWPFKVTSQYAGTGFKMLLNSAFIFVFIGLTVEVNMQLINAALTNNVSSGEVKIQSSTSDDVSFGGLQGIANAINTQNDTELVELTDISTMGFLILIFCCIFGFKFMGQVSSLAGQFSSGGIKPSAPSIATMGASAALSGAKKVTKPVREAVGRKAEDAEMAVVGAVAHPIRTAKSIGRSITSFANKFRGGKGSGDSDSESETTVENKEKSKSGTVENNGKPNGDKKKSPVVGQNNVNKEKTTVTAANTKPGSNGSGENHNTAGDEKNVNNEGGSQGDNSVNEVNTNNETSADNNSAPLNTGEPKEHKADSRKQRKYSGKKNRDRLQKNKQRRNYGRKHK